jgi:hypothetical protein
MRLLVNLYSYANAYKSKDKHKIAEQTQRYTKRLETLMNFTDKSNESLKKLMQICGLMNQHGVGLKTIQDTPNYATIKNEVLRLRKIVPNPEVNIRINTYFNWSDGLYSFLLGQKWVTSDPENFTLSSAEYKATSSYTRPTIEGFADTLIASVAESLQKGKAKTDNKSGDK